MTVHSIKKLCLMGISKIIPQRKEYSRKVFNSKTPQNDLFFKKLVFGCEIPLIFFYLYKVIYIYDDKIV